VRLWSAVAEHCPEGNIADVPDVALEDWVKWPWQRSRFAVEFRRLFAPDGIINAWCKHSGAALEKAERDRQRLNTQYESSRNSRARKPRNSQESRASLAGNGTVRNETENSPPPPPPARVEPVVRDVRPALRILELPAGLRAEPAEAAVRALLAALPPGSRPESWLASIQGTRSGLGMPSMTAAEPADIAVGLSEYLTAPSRDFNARHIPTFIARARAGRLKPPPRLPSATADDDETFAAVAARRHRAVAHTPTPAVAHG
jgi:hypothetical protein